MRKAISAVGVDGKGRRRVVVSAGRGGIGRHLGGGIGGGNGGSGETAVCGSAAECWGDRYVKKQKRAPGRKARTESRNQLLPS